MQRTMLVSLHLLQAFLLALTLSGCGGEAAAPAAAPTKDGANILAFGDSLTYGTGTEPGKSYPAVLQELIGRKVINAGIPGETTEQGLKRLPDALKYTQPDLVILCLGGNDMMRKQDRAQMKQNLAAMIQLIKARGIRVVLLGVPDPTLNTSGIDPSYRELAAEHGLALEAGILPEIFGDATRRSDHIHPDAVGYADIAKAVAKLLRETGAI